MISDIETGVKSWSNLNPCIDPTCWQMAQKIAANDKILPNEPNHVKSCTSWNNFKKDGCQYEFLNPGKSCKYSHFCSTCDSLGLGNLPHKAWECEFDPCDDYPINPTDDDLQDDYKY